MDLKRYELSQATSAEDWNSLHNLRRSELFARRPGIVYLPDHPDNHAPNNFQLLLKFEGKTIGTARLELLGSGRAAMRLVAITKPAQAKGHGRALVEEFEKLAREKDVAKVFVNAHQSAVGFYERLGYVHEAWDDQSAGLGDSVPMTKLI